MDEKVIFHSAMSTDAMAEERIRECNLAAMARLIASEQGRARLNSGNLAMAGRAPVNATKTKSS
jgi:hypothetical protein